jgi:hypothetical protein
MRLLRLLAASVAMLLAGPALAACDAPTVLFADSFDKLQPTWGEATDTLKVADGRLVVSPPAEQYFWAPNTAGLYDDIDLCVNVTTVTGVDPVDAKVGVVFWYVDVNNFYVFEIAPNGKASVWRRQRGKWLSQVNWQNAEGANQGDGAVNALEVQTAGSQATLSVNGTQFKQLTGSAPDNGQQIGILAVSPAKGAATFAFDDLKVVLPPKQ